MTMEEKEVKELELLYELPKQVDETKDAIGLFMLLAVLIAAFVVVAL